MKTIKSLIIIISLIFVSVNINAQNTQKQQLNTSVYDFVFTPMAKQTPEQIQTTAKVLALVATNIEVQNNQLTTSLKKSDFKKAGLPTGIHKVLIKSIKDFNSYVSKNNIQDVKKLVNTAIAKAKVEILKFY